MKEVITYLRKKQRMTIEGLAAYSHINYNTLKHKLNNEDAFTVKEVKAIAQALKVTPGTLLNGNIGIM